MSTIPEFSLELKPLYVEHQYEMLFYVYKALATSTQEVAQEALICLGREGLHNHLEFHQKLIRTALHFPLESLLMDNFSWIYRRLTHYGLDEEFFSYELRLWREAYAHFLPPLFANQLQELYMYVEERLGYLAKSHTQIKEAKYTDFSQEDAEEINRVYGWLSKRDYALLKAHVLEKCPSLPCFLNFFYRIISPVMERVGYEWERGVITVAKEHMISEQVGDLSMEMFAHFDAHRLHVGHEKRILVATSPKELHAIGAKTMTKLLEFYGFKVFYLGSDLSVKEIIGAVSETLPDVLVFSVTLEVHLVELQELILTLRSRPIEYHGAIVLGGGALKHLNKPVEIQGADAVCLSFDDVLEFVKGH